LQLINDLTRYVNVILAVLIVFKGVRAVRASTNHRLAILFPALIALQVIFFAVLQSTGQVDPLVLNWLSQLIRFETLLYLLAV
jgi:hypothetical protein